PGVPPYVPATPYEMQLKGDDRLQRAAASESKEQPLRRKADEKLQRAAMTDEKVQRADDGKLRRAPADEAQVPSAAIGMATVRPDLQAAIEAGTTGGQPLPAGVRDYMDPRFESDFSNVRIHNDVAAAGLSNQLSARAFTYRNHIFFSRDQYQPGTSE